MGTFQWRFKRGRKRKRSVFCEGERQRRRRKREKKRKKSERFRGVEGRTCSARSEYLMGIQDKNDKNDNYEYGVTLGAQAPMACDRGRARRFDRLGFPLNDACSSRESRLGLKQPRIVN